MKILFVLDLYKPHVWWVEILFENIANRMVEKWQYTEHDDQGIALCLLVSKSELN